jgi:formylglycine-generating enzyme required for sulfatase activity
MRSIDHVRRWLLALALTPVIGLAADDGYVRLPGGDFRSALRYEDTGGRVSVAPFELMRRPVTNADFLVFVQAHPEWRRDRVAKIFAETSYLQQWAGPEQLATHAQSMQPVVNVSWFAADAYCQAQGARLPTWSEWEYSAAADATRTDARGDATWRESILNWYAKPSNAPLDTVGKSPANVYGVQDLHGLIWEWVEDYSSLLVSGDSREQKDPDLLKFCGAGAISMDDRENYAVLMRVAMLSSLQAVNSTSNLGFRCAKTSP